MNSDIQQMIALIEELMGLDYEGRIRFESYLWCYEFGGRYDVSIMHNTVKNGMKVLSGDEEVFAADLNSVDWERAERTIKELHMTIALGGK
jgi:hypothetical protein